MVLGLPGKVNPKDASLSERLCQVRVVEVGLPVRLQPSSLYPNRFSCCPMNKIDRSDILRLAAESGLDVRTVKRAVDRGVASLRAGVDRDRLKAAATKLGVRLS